MNQPVKYIDLHQIIKKKLHSSKKKTEKQSLNVTSMDFPQEDANNFYIGCEDGVIYKAQIHSNEGGSASRNVKQSYIGHQGPITSLSFHPQQSQISPLISGLMLSSSFDWFLKLWNPKVTNQCLKTFDYAEDYIYDVQWNPIHPTLFASGDGEGTIDFWDLSADF